MRAMGVMGVVPAAVALLVAVAGCEDQGPDAELLDELERNEELWHQARPGSYVFALERMCFCGVEYRGPARLRVEGDVVKERVYVDTNEPVPSPFADAFPTVDGLFDLLRDAIVTGAHTVEVTYDPVLGAPLDFWIDYDERVADEESGAHVTEAVSPQ